MLRIAEYPNLTLLGMVLALVATACSTDSFPSEFGQKPSAHFDVTQNEYYGAAEPALKQLVFEENKNTVANEFCVVGYAYPDEIINVVNTRPS